MRRIQFLFFHILLGGLLSLACNHIGPQSTTYPAPPATSYRVESVSLDSDGGAHAIRAAFVKPEFIKAGHVQPMIGRNFVEEEYQAKSQGVALLSHGLWRQRFASNPNMIGENLNLNGRAYTVVGVMPKAFKHPKEAEIWLPDQTK
jgi:hypothetical protein